MMNCTVSNTHYAGLSAFADTYAKFVLYISFAQ